MDEVQQNIENDGLGAKLAHPGENRPDHRLSRPRGSRARELNSPPVPVRNKRAKSAPIGYPIEPLRAAFWDLTARIADRLDE
jgi:hypothetical protein